MNQEDLHRLILALGTQDKRADELTLRMEDLESLVTLGDWLTGQRLAIGGIDPTTVADGDGHLAGNLTVGDGTGARHLTIDGASGYHRNLVFQSGGVDRWRIRTQNTAESGSDVGSDFEIVARTDAGAYLSTPIKIWRKTGAIQLGGADFYTVPWTDYSGTSTLVGWTSYTTKVIEYKKIGKLVFVHYNIVGTSDPGANGIYARFSLPYNEGVGGIPYHVSFIMNNGVRAFGWCYMSGATCYFTKSATAATNGWSQSGQKRLFGQFFYEAA